MRGAEVWLDPTSPSSPHLKQGKTDESGRIVIYGAHPGSIVRVSKGTSWATITVDCSETQVWRQEVTVEAAPQPLR